jgi:hypothetical protein
VTDFRSLPCAAAALLLVAISACGPPAGKSPAGSSPNAGARVLSISANARSQPASATQDFVAAVDLAYNAGARGNFVSYTWKALEPKAGTWSFNDLRGAVDYLGDTRKTVLLVGIQVINTTARETPADLAGAAFDSAEMKARFRALINALKPIIGGRVKYLSIGNEVDVYLSSHPEQWAAYRAFYADAVKAVHASLPGIQVGVTTTFTSSQTQESKITELNAPSDVYMLTYYPLGASFRPRQPTTVDADITQMLRQAGARPLVLQEVGYPSATELGSSEKAQADFVSLLLDRWSAAGASRIPFLNFFLLHNLARETCDQLAAYYGLGGDANFKAYLCTLGLRRADGTPKSAWQALVSGAKKTGLP